MIKAGLRMSARADVLGAMTSEKMACERANDSEQQSKNQTHSVVVLIIWAVMLL